MPFSSELGSISHATDTTSSTKRRDVIKNHLIEPQAELSLKSLEQSFPRKWNESLHVSKGLCLCWKQRAWLLVLVWDSAVKKKE